MPIAKRSFGVFLACFMCSFAGCAIILDGADAATRNGFATQPSISLRSLAVPSVQALDGYQQIRDEVDAARRSPMAVAARERSRTAYERLDSAGVARLIRNALPATVSTAPGPIGGWLHAHYLSSNAAEATLPDGKHIAVESFAPMAVATSPGHYAPVDLDLRSSTGGYTSVRSAAGVLISTSSLKGARLLSSGISLIPSNSSGKPLNRRGRRDAKAVVYPNIQTDTDVVAKAKPLGLESYDVLRSVRSPQEVDYSLHIPVGATIVRHKDGIDIVLAGTTIGVIPTPTAEDATGAPVPVKFSLRGRTLRIGVAHRKGDFRYPIVVDPSVEDTNLLLTTSNWRFEASGVYFKAYGETLTEKYWRLEISSGHLLNEWGVWLYPTQGESHIYALTTESEGVQPASNIQATVGIINSSGWENDTVMPSNFSKTSTTVCLASCTTAGGTASNLAAYWATAIGTGTTAKYSLYSAVVYIAQTNGPSVSANTTSEKIGARMNALYGSGTWMSKTSGALEFKISDPGVGVHETEYVVPAEGKKWTKSWVCNVQCPPSGKETVQYADSGVGHMPDGEPTLEVKALNSMGSVATTAVKVKVDATAPHEVTLSGIPSEGQIGDAYRALKLTAKATDGSGTTISSGMASLTLKMDGRQIGNPAGACSPGPCSATAEWSINAEGYSAGSHTLEVVAVDKAGNTTTSGWPITIHHASFTALGPGEVNPISGAFKLEESDVDIPTSGASLTLGRSYNSLEPGAGSEEPLGSPWRVSFGGAQKLESIEGGNVVLTAPDGSGSTFVYKSSGHYTPPVGDVGMSLSYASGEWGEWGTYTLEDNGAKTVFTHVEGDAENVWRPTGSTGAGGTSAITYSYTVSGGVARPSEEVGPVPSGVTCTPELKAGCRALTFNYASSTTAAGEGPSEWGDYVGHLTRIYLTAYDPSTKAMTTTTVAQYAYDLKGRLRAVWDPRVSPALKTTYGYDSEGHLTSVAPPGGEPWVLLYGTTGSDTRSGRLVSVGRPTASTALGSGKAPVNTVAPQLTMLHPVPGKAMSAWSGAWSESPLRYGYQWQRCDASGNNCVLIGGAINHEYTPTEADLTKTLRVRVTAINAGGAVAATTAPSAVVASTSAGVPQQLSTFGSIGSGNGQLSSPWGIARDWNGNVWIADAGNNRIEEFNSEGAFVRVAGTSGTGLLAGPEDVAVDGSGDAWVADTGKSRIVEFNSSGTYVRSFGTAGTGTGQFKSPWGITVDGSNHVWVVDAGNDRIQEFTWEGAFIRSFGSEGTGNGQLKSPGGVSIDSKGNVWVADTGNSRVQEFSPEGTYIRQFGSSGSGNGQFCSPWRLAIDPNNDQVWVADSCNNRVQVFSPTGEFVEKFGSSGSGTGQFSSPAGIAFSMQGYVYILDKGNSRVAKWSDGAPQPSSEFGMSGAGNGQLSNPWGVARDSSGNVWVADAGNNRIEEFSGEGAFVRVAGTSGTGSLSEPEDVAVDASGDVWVTDTYKSRIVEFNPSGEYVRSFGTAGTGTGQFKSPWGITVDGSNHVWVVDAGNNRIQEFTAEGTFIRSFGSEGTGNGQFKSPGEVATDSKGNLWVADTGNSRMQEFTGEGVYIRQFGSSGTGHGQFCSPWRLAVDPANDQVWVADMCNNTVQVFSPTGEFIEKMGSFGYGQGQLYFPEGIAFSQQGYVYILDKDNNRVVKWSDGDEAVSVGQETSTATMANSTLEYGVPVSGAGAPYSLASTDVAKWGQADVPTEGTAFFPPDEPMGWPASDYKRATIEYFDVADHAVNVARPTGGISTAEYNSYNDVTRTLTADNREAALKEGAKSAEASQNLDTQSTYGSEGTELLSTLGPQHAVKLASGATVQARKHVAYSYDEGAPAGGPYRLVTKTTEGAQIAGEPEADVRTSTVSYAGQNNLGWLLRKPTATRTDPSGLKLTRTTVYDPTSGDVTETRTPAAGAPNEEILTGYVYNLVFGETKLLKPGGIARDHEGDVWVANTSCNCVDEYSASGVFLREFGSFGSGNGQLSGPEGIAVDESGSVWVADTGNNRIEQFTATGTYVSQFGSVGTGWKQFKGPSAIVATTSTSRLYVADAGNNRIEEFTSSGEEAAEYGSSGTGNGQFSKPEGLALDSSGNLWVADTGNNRVQEIKPKKPGPWEWMQKFGALGSGNGQLSKPEGIAIDVEGNVWVADGGNNRVQEFSSTGTYELQFASATTVKTPAGIAVDPNEDVYVLDTGNHRVQEWVPPGSVHGSSGTGGTHGTQTIYFTAGTNGIVAACGEHPEWAGLPCERKLATQPGTSGIPNPPVTTFTYNMLDEPLTTTETVGSTTRVTSVSYDNAGRTLSESSTSSVGTALPTVESSYDSTTGAPTKVSTSLEGTTHMVEATFDKLGRLGSYKDSDGNTSTYAYDIDGRLESESDGKGTQKYTYSSTSGLLSQLVDSNAGTFTATYDAEGSMATVGYPNGMTATTTRDSSGYRTGLEYVKTTHCSSACTWYSDSLVRSIHGQVLTQTSTLSGQAYTYDAAGRLSKVQDTPAGSGCTTRIYSFDEETNLTSLTTRPPGAGGVCASEGGSAENHLYDTANRLNDSGIAYSTFGDITKLPAADAGGSELASTYYTDGTLASQTQAGETIGYYLDPAGRPRQTVFTGTTNSTVTSHYSVGANAEWTEDTAGDWTRNVHGIGGELVATVTNGASPVLEIENLHGDIVATASSSETATGLLTTSDPTEYGVPRTGTPPKYGWLGSQQLSTELPSGIIAMGARSYDPRIGRFLQPDPVEGGSANAYAYTFGDPVNTADPSGEYTVGTPGWVHEFFNEQAVIATEEAIQRAAEEQAAKEEAEAKVQEALEEAWAATSEIDYGAGGGGGKGKKAAKGRKSLNPLDKTYVTFKVMPGGDCDKKCQKMEKEIKYYKKIVEKMKPIKATVEARNTLEELLVGEVNHQLEREAHETIREQEESEEEGD